METEKSSLVWAKKAELQLLNAYEKICLESVQNANKVLDAIIANSEKTQKHPEKFPLDKYKLNNDGTYRAFEMYHLRISYRLKNNIVRILRVRHNRRIPKRY